MKDCELIIRGLFNFISERRINYFSKDTCIAIKNDLKYLLDLTKRMNYNI